MYKRLMRFVEDAKANETLSDYDSKHSSTLDAIREAEERIQHFREYQGFQGQTGDAINKWLEDAERRVRLWKASYLATSQVEVEMRRVMQHAREEAEMLSPVLVDARLDKLRDVAEVTIPVMEQYGLVGMAYNAVASTGAAVYDAIAAQANNQREASSTDILQRLNDSMQGLANNAARIKEMQEELKAYSGIYWDPNDLPHPSDTSVAQQLEDGYKGVSPHDPGVYPGNRDTDYPNGFDDPTAQETDAEKLRRLQSQRIPDKFIKDGELGSRSNPITDPEDLKDIDLLHSRIGGERYANGTVGGYTPAPPNDRHHPLASTPPAVRAWRVRVPSVRASSVRAPSAPQPWARAARRAWVPLHSAGWVAAARVAWARAASAGCAGAQLPAAVLAPAVCPVARARRAGQPA